MSPSSAVGVVLAILSVAGSPEGRWWSDSAEAALARAGANRSEIEKALAGVPEGNRRSMEFLVENMPARDLESLSADFLLENVALAHEAWEAAPWKSSVPADLFLEEVLPYACVNERRDAWRPALRKICAPLVAECATPAAAARRLNETLFGQVKVRYSTGRRRADQSPLESMESGLASCTGLSILLVDACRSVGVPARVAGIPSWTDGRGNHTWVEIWDGKWWFAGAAEPDPAGLDRGWFAHDASLAVEDSPAHAIYAASFKKTALSFPMVWAARDRSVSAVNVTARYAAPAPAAKPRLFVRVLDRPGGQRVVARVVVTAGGESREGTSRDESADTNDMAAFEVEPDRAYEVVVEAGGRTARREVTGSKENLTLEIALEENPASTAAPSPLEAALAEFFVAPPEAQAEWRFDPSLDALVLEDEDGAREAAWRAWRGAPIHDATRRDHEERLARSGALVSPYTLKTVGTKPAGGWGLFIAMHGGGGAPKEVNDSQWNVMGRYYRDQADVPGYLYLALRAPNDEWNGFYADYVYPLIANLIAQLLLHEDVDPDRVYILGYSHGGYGAFSIGPKMADRFAAIHSSAAAPTDGQISPRTLRSTVFTFMIGENDHAYGRVERCRAFDEAIRSLRGDRTDIYPVTMELKAGHGHGGLPDRDKIRDLSASVRNPVPREISWELTDPVIRDFFWLQVPAPVAGQSIEARLADNRVVLETRGVPAAHVLLDGRMVDWRRPVVVEVDGETTTLVPRPSLLTLCRTILERRDPRLAFTVRVPVAGRP